MGSPCLDKSDGTKDDRRIIGAAPRLPRTSSGLAWLRLSPRVVREVFPVRPPVAVVVLCLAARLDMPTWLAHSERERTWLCQECVATTIITSIPFGVWRILASLFLSVLCRLLHESRSGGRICSWSVDMPLCIA
jgi:hypothetical protein